MFALLLVSLLVVPVLSLPSLKLGKGCSLKDARLSVPSNQSVLTAPTTAPSFIALGVGVQNYTCNATSSTYDNVGAVVEVFDISCLYGTPEFDTVQDDAYTVWTKTPSFVTAQDVISTFGSNKLVLGQHYFISNPDGSSTISPVWDFTTGAEKGKAEAFIIAAVVGDLPAPTGPDDVDWVQLKNVSGQLADAVYRVDTKAGQPPAECTVGDQLLSVKFTTKYWLFGGSVKE
jgi:hypothetical protein